MSDRSEIDYRHDLTLDRMERNHALALTRQRENEMRRQEYKREAAIIEGENALEIMNRKHELDIENRQLDHLFNRAEDAREVERLASEIAIRRRDDFIRHQWQSESSLFKLEAQIIEALTHGAIAERQSNVDHGHTLEIKGVEHINAKDMAAHENELDKDNYEFKRRLDMELATQSGSINDEEIAASYARLRKRGTIKSE